MASGSPEGSARLSDAELSDDFCVAQAAVDALSRLYLGSGAARAIDAFHVRMDPRRALRYVAEVRRLRALITRVYNRVDDVPGTEELQAELEGELVSLRGDQVRPV